MVTPDDNVLLAVHDLETRFGARIIHDGLNLEVKRGELLALFGGSGTGKSTLLRALIGLERPSRGQITFAGTSLLSLDAEGWREMRKRIGYSFQSGALFDSLTVGENLEFPLAESGTDDDATRKQVVAAMLERVGLPGIEDKYPAELSGGMQKRVGLARTLMLDPELVLYDEPTAGLDPANTRKICELMRTLTDAGKTGILVTHDVPAAMAVADRIAYLENGKIAVVQARPEVEGSPDPHIASYINGEIA